MHSGGRSTELMLCTAGDNLSLVEADLMSDAGWAQAAAGCEYVLHVASPLPAQGGFTEDEVVTSKALYVAPYWLA